MADEKFKVFISWSDSPSKDIAKLLEAWLPDIFDNIQPWVSDTGIDPGARSYRSIAEALANAQMGIIVATRANQQAPWITYEAGALSNLFGAEQTRVVPLLVDFHSQSDVTSPLSQFQNCMLDQTGMVKLCRQISKFMGSNPDSIAKRVDMFWGNLEAGVAKAIQDASETTVPDRKPDDVMDEILSTVRAIQRRGDSSPVYRSSQLYGRPGQIEGLIADLLQKAFLVAHDVRRRGTLDGVEYISVAVPVDVDDAAVQAFLTSTTRFRGMSVSVDRGILLPETSDIVGLEEAVLNLPVPAPTRDDETRRRIEDDVQIMNQMNLDTNGM